MLIWLSALATALAVISAALVYAVYRYYKRALDTVYDYFEDALRMQEADFEDMLAAQRDAMQAETEAACREVRAKFAEELAPITDSLEKIHARLQSEEDDEVLKALKKFEQNFRDGMNDIMSYSLDKAREAVTRNAIIDETET